VVEKVKGLYKQPGSDNWHFEFEVTVNGAPYRVRRSSGTTDAKQALALKARLKEEYKQRTVASAGGFTTMRLHEALERYGKQMLRADANKFASVAKRLVVAFGANTLLDDISTERITAWTEQMLLGGKLMPMKGGRQGQKPPPADSLSTSPPGPFFCPWSRSGHARAFRDSRTDETLQRVRFRPWRGPCRTTMRSRQWQ
jgi:hypothetical protein